MTKNVCRSSCTVPLLSYFNANLIFGNTQTPIRPKPVQWQRSVFYACRRTDRHDKANSRFSQFCESTKKNTNENVRTVQYFKLLHTEALLCASGIRKWWKKTRYLQHNGRDAKPRKSITMLLEENWVYLC